MNTINTEFSSVEVQFINQASKALEIEDNVNLALITGQTLKKMRYPTEPKFRKYVKGYGFLSFARRFSDKYDKKLMNTATKTRIDAAKTASKRVVQKTAEATGDLIGNKIADKITSKAKSKKKGKNKQSRSKLHFTRKNATIYW